MLPRGGEGISSLRLLTDEQALAREFETLVYFPSSGHAHVLPVRGSFSKLHRWTGTYGSADAALASARTAGLNPVGVHYRFDDVEDRLSSGNTQHAEETPRLGQPDPTPRAL